MLRHKKTVYYYLALLDRIGGDTRRKHFLLGSSVGSDWCCDTKENSFIY